MGALGSGMVVFNLLREVNLREIKREADQPFTLHILGEVGAATRLAEALSAAPGKHGIHPWVRVVPLPLAAPDGLSAPGPNDGFTVALVLNDGVDPDTNARAALSRLRALRIPSLSVVQNDDAVDLVGAATPRPGETARVVLPAGLPGDELVAQLAPALFERLPADDGARVALARQLPALRRNVIASLIDPTARANAMYAATTGLAEWVPILNLPLNAADVIVLTKNQLIMAYKIALAAGKNGQPRDLIGENVSVLFAGDPFNYVSILAQFNGDGSYTVRATDADGQQGTLSGAYTADNTTEPATIVLVQANPYTATAEGIWDVSGSTLTYEVVQTDPEYGFAPPTPESGFGTTSGPNIEAGVNVQVYVRQ